MAPPPRAAFAVLLAATVAPLAAGGLGPFVGWALTGAGLLLARRAGLPRRAVAVGLATLALVVVLTLVGAGVTLGRTGVGLDGASWENLAFAFALAGVWLPAGAFLALAARDAPARLAAAGVVAALAWCLLYAGMLLAEGAAFGDPRPPRGEGHVAGLAVGALLVTGALAWRTLRPPAPPSRGDPATAAPAAAP